MKVGFYLPVTLTVSCLAVGLLAQSGNPMPAGPTITVDTPMPAPAWANAERLLLQANGEGVRTMAARVMDDRGFPLGGANWGVGDGPDDHMEAIRSWPLAHAVGGPDEILDLWNKAFEGYLTKYSQAKVPEVPAAKDGIFHKEFITSFDWEHTGEGLAPFYFYGLSRPDDARYVERARRWAGLYMNEDPDAQNYNPKLKIIRSLFNGSRGPQLRPATVDDWDGPLPQGVSPTASRRTRFQNSSNIRGDHPLNLAAVMVPMHAYLLTREAKYRNWVLEYVDAWRERTEKNGGNIPSNIGLDGTIGGEWGGKWYGGIFGWNSPDEGVRNYVFRGPPEAFNSALLLTGDQRYVGVLRRQIDNLFAAQKIENGKVLLPRFYRDNGWDGYYELGAGPSGSLGNLVNVIVNLYIWSWAPADLARVPALSNEAQFDTPPGTDWLRYLQSRDASYPMQALQRALDTVRRPVAAPAGTASGRGAEGAGRGAPAIGGRGARAGGAGAADGGGAGRGAGGGGGRGGRPVALSALVNLTMGGPDPGGSTHGPLPLNVQVRHFNPERRRAGLPEDVAALVEHITADQVVLTLVNINSQQERTVSVQMGAYGEHMATAVAARNRTTPVNAPWFNVRLRPGAGETLTVGIRRYVNQPTLAFPWDRNRR